MNAKYEILHSYTLESKSLGPTLYLSITENDMLNMNTNKDQMDTNFWTQLYVIKHVLYDHFMYCNSKYFSGIFEDQTIFVVLF